MQQAFQLIERMRDRNIILTPYLDQVIIDRVYASVGVAQPSAAPLHGARHDGHGGHGHDDVEDEIPEEDG